jgi:DnaJ-class molecular chaperone
MSIDLSLFCANKLDPREPLHQPFSFETHSAASNGHIAIIIPRRRDIPQLKKYPSSALNRLLMDAIKKRGTDAETAALSIDQLELDTTDCYECNGAGLTHACPECAGAGEIECWTDCKKCDGSGTITLDEMQRLRNSYTYDPGYQKNPHRCQTCAGLGKQTTETTYRIGSATVNPNYLLRLKTLPNATAYAFGKHDAILIVFTGGLGLLMPIWQNPINREQ